MIEITDIDYCGGQCPWQLFGWSNDKEVYVKYRNGTLRIHLGDEIVYSEKIGLDLDGYFTLDMLREHCFVAEGLVE